nr:immunoglobulin light chain junction region [Macaca mulatta]MOV96425.1 immunoglobulin light chain junction region [Macaca mulatta]MOV97539.1 immunoglobulin light chain junction region [Macaca mulatta]MOV99349.1 immunoglobulin light chain junction region [Macaca mulatta]
DYYCALYMGSGVSVF